MVKYHLAPNPLISVGSRAALLRVFAIVSGRWYYRQDDA
jgi:hypothetical protein